MTTRRRLGMRVPTAWKAGVLAFVTFCLLASGSLVKSASAQDEGLARDVALGLAEGIDRVSNFFSLNRPLDWINETLDRPETEPDVKFPPTTLLPPVGTTTTTVPPPTLSPTRPLLMKLYGDSQGQALGATLQRATAEDPLIEATYDARVSTGLARPDYYNWPARIVADVERRAVDVVVVNWGANDTQALRDVEGALVAEVGTPEWDVEYRRRVAGFMDLLHRDPRRLVWIGQPTMRDPTRNARMQHMNQIAREEAATRPWVTYIDAATVIDGPNGPYHDYLTPPDGPAIRCRQSDGIHLTFDCDRIVIDEVLRTVRPIFPVATTTTVAPTTTAAPTTTTTTQR